MLYEDVVGVITVVSQRKLDAFGSQARLSSSADFSHAAVPVEAVPQLDHPVLYGPLLRLEKVQVLARVAGPLDVPACAKPSVDDQRWAGSQGVVVRRPQALLGSVVVDRGDV